MSPAIFLLPWNPTYKLSLWRFPILSSNSLSTDPWLRESHVLRIALAPINSHWELRTLETVSVPKHKSMLHFLRTCGSLISATLWNHDGESFKEYTLFNMFSQYLEAWAWRGRVFGFDLLCLTLLVPWCRSLRASGMFLFKWWPHTSWSKSNNQGHYQYQGRKEESESRHPFVSCVLDLEDWESEVGKLSSLVCPSDDNNWQELLHWGIWQTISMSRCSCSTERAQTQEQKHMPAQWWIWFCRSLPPSC